VPERATKTRSPWLRVFHFSQRPEVVFALACVALVVSGRAPELVAELIDPVGALIGVGLGVLAFALSLALLEGPRRGVATWLATLHGFVRVGVPARRLLTLLGRASYEEAFWRGTLQVLLARLLPTFAAVACIAGAFTARHVYLEYVNRRPRGRARIFEFAVFALILGSSYALSERLIVVVMIHATRNVLLQALGDSRRA
jgi:membrane protease YdiL (CAAX protease family)